jgi:hypothetical protein
MDYGDKIVFLFFSILIFLSYTMVFGLLHGLQGIAIWALVAVMLFFAIKAAI